MPDREAVSPGSALPETRAPSGPAPAGPSSQGPPTGRPSVPGARTPHRPPRDPAAAAELREALDELRQVLDVQAPPSRVDRWWARRRWLLAALAALVVIGGLLVLELRTDPAPRIVSGGAGGSPSSRADTDPTGGPSTSATWSTRELDWPGGAVLVPPDAVRTGPGVTVPGTDVQVAADRDGQHLDVFERLLLPDRSGQPLTLAVAALPSLGSPPTVTDLQLELDGVATDPADQHLYTRATLRYRLGGSLTSATPAAAGRALAVAVALTGGISQQHGAPVVIRSTDSHVLGITCPAAGASASICGARPASGGWSATVPAGTTPAVLLQLESTPGGTIPTAG